MDQTTYHGILQIIQDAGKMMERQPSTYDKKKEEDLRDMLLFVLQPHYEGSATGETFNKQGKTDILLRYQGQNAFIAECKFWHGEVGFHESISQVLSYLTWRDSKAAVIVFVQNKDFSGVLAKVEKHAPRHPNYLGFINRQEETWFNFRFHLVGDKNREVKLAVLRKFSVGWRDTSTFLFIRHASQLKTYDELRWASPCAWLGWPSFLPFSVR